MRGSWNHWVSERGHIVGWMPDDVESEAIEVLQVADAREARAIVGLLEGLSVRSSEAERLIAAQRSS